MTTVSRFELILLLMAVVVALELVARRIRMPPAAAFILGGIALALIPGTPDVELDPDLALVLFLPPLLLASAYFTVWRDFRANLRIINAASSRRGCVHDLSRRCCSPFGRTVASLGCLLRARRDCLPT